MSNEPMVPMSLVTRMMESYEAQIAQLHDLLKPKTPAPIPMGEFKPWKSEEEEDAEYIALAEKAALDALTEMGFNAEDIKVE